MNDEIFESDAERAWSESTHVYGVDQDLMNARQGDHPNTAAPKPAALAPILIPAAALMAGPLVAALLTLFVDGRPPKLRHTVAILSTGIGIWLCRQGLTALSPEPISPSLGPILALLLMSIAGALLWAIYAFWQKGRRAMDKQTLNSSALVVVALSFLYWFGRDSSWWTLLGR